MIALQGRSRHLAISDSSQVGDARRVAAGLAEGVGLNATQTGQVSIIATELANNILKHAQRGEIILRAIEQGGRRGVEMLSLDQGPGMADVEKCLRDGYSTAGSCGTGLGSISRLSTHFDIYSVPQQGTVLLAQVVEPGKERLARVLKREPSACRCMRARAAAMRGRCGLRARAWRS